MTDEEKKARKREASRKHYQRNREEIKARVAEYRKANRDAIKAKKAEHYKANAEKIKAYLAEYRKANAEKIKAYRKANAEVIKAYSAEYHKAKRTAWTTVLHEMGFDCCPECGYDRCLSAIEAHHRDPGGKEIKIARWLTEAPSGANVTKLKAELSKCTPRCSRCHSLEHIMDAAGGEEWATGGALWSRAQREEWGRWINQNFDNRCACCGWDGANKTLAWHHLRDKETTLAAIAQGKMTPEKQARYRAEAAKCVRVCKNCHAEIHAGLIELPEQQQSQAA